jgi:hypothetical protein
MVFYVAIYVNSKDELEPIIVHQKDYKIFGKDKEVVWYQTCKSEPEAREIIKWLKFLGQSGLKKLSNHFTKKDAKLWIESIKKMKFAKN